MLYRTTTLLLVATSWDPTSVVRQKQLLANAADAPLSIVVEHTLHGCVTQLAQVDVSPVDGTGYMAAVCYRAYRARRLEEQQPECQCSGDVLLCVFPAGNLVGLILSPLILLQFGWRALFYTFGLVGVPLLAMWLASAPKPLPKAAPPPAAESPKAAAGGGDAKESVSVGQLLSHPATWAIIIVNIVNHWGYFIYLNWMPSYFVKVCATVSTVASTL